MALGIGHWLSHNPSSFLSPQTKSLIPSLSLSVKEEASTSRAKMLEDSASAIPSSIWASMNSWFTPTVLFLLLNLMIATIAFTSSSFSNHKHQNQSQNQNQNHSPIARSPSVLQRLKSINFYSSPPPPDSSLHHKQIPDSDVQAAHYFFQNHNPHETVDAAPQPQPDLISDARLARELQNNFDLELKNLSSDDFVGEKAVEEEENHEKSMDEVYSQLADSHFTRTKSDTKPTGGEIPAKLPAKMRKSASVKSAFAHFEEEDIVEARRPATVKEWGNARVADADEEGVDAKADDFINRFKQQLKLQRLDSIIRYKDMIGRGR